MSNNEKRLHERSHKELHLKFVSHGGGEYRRTGAFPCSFSHRVFWQSSKHHSNCVFVHVWVTVHHPAELGMEAICLALYLHCWSSAPIDFISNSDCDHFLCVTLAGGWTTRQRDFASFFSFIPITYLFVGLKVPCWVFLTNSSTNEQYFPNFVRIKHVNGNSCCHFTAFYKLTVVWCDNSVKEENFKLKAEEKKNKLYKYLWVNYQEEVMGPKYALLLL